MWSEMGLVGIGAVVGANLRYLVSKLAAKYLSASLPIGTLIINATGSFILGFFMIAVTEKLVVDPRWRPLIAVGFCGGYTTFSSYSYETFSLFEQGHYALATGNFLANNVLSLGACVAGAILARVVYE